MPDPVVQEVVDHLDAYEVCDDGEHCENEHFEGVAEGEAPQFEADFVHLYTESNQDNYGDEEQAYLDAELNPGLVSISNLTFHNIPRTHSEE